ncbi:hypothetical protein [Paenibacillus medicaginis]|uniref:Transposase n=1 Tax=Paenibacillus medicaginis TaxID=1470560 RepID=A0ABV5BZX0_9BACL
MELIMSVADLYYRPAIGEDDVILSELREQCPEEGEEIMELMPIWKKIGYEEGKEKATKDIIRKLLDKGFDPEQVADALELPVDEVRKTTKK